MLVLLMDLLIQRGSVMCQKHHVMGECAPSPPVFFIEALTPQCTVLKMGPLRK